MEMTKEEFEALRDEEKLRAYYEHWGQEVQEAEWSTEYINTLPDISFAVIESGGEKDEDGKTTPRGLRHLPHHGKITTHTATNVDEAHLKNAAARANQVKPAGGGASAGRIQQQAKTHLRRHYKAMGWDIPGNLEWVRRQALEDITFSQVHFIGEERIDEQFNVPYRQVRILGMKADVVNLNDRLYPMAVLRAQIPRAKGLISKGRFVGLADHPSIFGVGLRNTILKFEDVWMGTEEGPNDQSNEVWLDGKLIMTSVGQDIAVILASGIQVGVSARGYGRAKPVYTEDGKTFLHNEVQPDYQLEGFDLVDEPAESEARVYRFEHREDGPMTLDQISEAYPEVMAELEVRYVEEIEGLQVALDESKAGAEEKAETLVETKALADALSEQNQTLDALLAEQEKSIKQVNEELLGLREVKSAYEALLDLIEKVQGEQFAYLLLVNLKDCKTKEEITDRLPQEKERVERELHNQPLGKGFYPSAPSDLDEKSDEAKAWNLRQGGLAD